MKPQESLYHKIKELKQLVDEGLITQEEFDSKKSEYLKIEKSSEQKSPINVICPYCETKQTVTGVGNHNCIECEKTFRYNGSPNSSTTDSANINSNANTAIIFGVLSIFFGFTMIIPILAIFFGNEGIAEAKKKNSIGNNSSVTAIILGILGGIVGIIAFLDFVS